MVEICELEYSKATDNPVRWVLAGHEDAPFQRAEDLQGKRIATEAVNLTRQRVARCTVVDECVSCVIGS